MRRRRRNPDEAWTGTEKQIAWAKRIREEALPVIDQWIKQVEYRSAEDFRRGYGSTMSRLDVGRLKMARAVTDAKFWIDNRNCGTYGAFLSAYRKFTEARRNPGTAGSLLGIGTLSSLEVEVSGRARTIKTPGKWLGWEPKARKFHICRVLRRATADGITANVRSAHRRFHQEAPRKALLVDAPAPKGALRLVGLLRALVYRVPSRMVLSPEKNPYAWHHAFGDTGHKGGTTYPDRVKPHLCKDSAGNLFICRRKGNIFTVDTWLRG